jgi:hypothetical protein
VSAYTAALEQERAAKLHLLKKLRALAAASEQEAGRISEGHAPSLKDINRRWLAVEEATVIHRACAHAVDRAAFKEAG